MKHLDKQDSELKSEVLMMKSQMVETKKNFELKLQNATKKSKAPERETCPALTFNSFSELQDNLKTFCQGYDRVDLVHEDVLKFAFVRIDDSHIPTSKAKEVIHKALKSTIITRRNCSQQKIFPCKTSRWKCNDHYAFLNQENCLLFK